MQAKTDCRDGKCKPGDDDLFKNVIIVGGAAVGGTAAVVAAPLVAGALGFTAGGIAAGSFGASMMSVMAGGTAAVVAAPLVAAALGFTAGGIAAGSVCASMMSAMAPTAGGVAATLQSIGAAGMGVHWVTKILSPLVSDIYPVNNSTLDDPSNGRSFVIVMEQLPQIDNNF